MRIDTSHLATADSTIILPTAVHMLDDGRAIACHADSGDVEYPSLTALEAAYQIEVIQPANPGAIRKGMMTLRGTNRPVSPSGRSISGILAYSASVYRYRVIDGPGWPVVAEYVYCPNIVEAHAIARQSKRTAYCRRCDDETSSPVNENPMPSKMIAILGLEAIGDHYRGVRFMRLPKHVDRRFFETIRHQNRTPEVWEIIDHYRKRRVPFRRDYSRANGKGSRGVYKYFTLEEGKLYLVRELTSWKNERKYHVTAREGHVIELSEQEVDAWLSAASENAG